MAKIRGTRSRQGAGDGWPEAVIRWVRAIGNLKLLRAQSKLFSWTRLGLGRPTPVALARNGPGGSDIGTGEGSDGGGQGGRGGWPTCIWILGMLDEKQSGQVPTANLTMQSHSHPWLAGCSRDEANSGPKVQRIDGTRQNQISPGRPVSEPARDRLAPGRLPPSGHRRAREPTGSIP